MNQKYIEVGLHKKRESAGHCRFALGDDYGAQNDIGAIYAFLAPCRKKHVLQTG